MKKEKLTRNIIKKDLQNEVMKKVIGHKGTVLLCCKRDKYLKALRNQGLSIRQISRLTGIGFNIVRKF